MDRSRLVDYTEAIGASAERSHCCRGNERPSLIATGSSLNPPPSEESHGLTNPGCNYKADQKPVTQLFKQSLLFVFFVTYNQTAIVDPS